MEEIGRRHPVHQPTHEQHNVPVIIFVTICAKGRKTILANEEAHQLLRTAWEWAGDWIIGRYVVMPDHIHLFCAPGEYVSQPLSQWVGFWKSHAARHWPRPSQAPVWQRHFWDTQLRRGESYDKKWEYVLQNPVRAGLVRRAEDWSYAGEMHPLRW